MPGHKRNAAGFAARSLGGAERIDVTETPATDDLHHAEGILKEAQERANELYRTGMNSPLCEDMETFFLVGGSSAGVLAAVCTAVGEDGTVIALSGAHRSFTHAAELMRLTVSEVRPEEAVDADGIVYDFPGTVDPAKIEEALARHPEARAVFLTSPGYEGVIQDVKAIADIAHRKGIPLIVDEAHGAHFSLHPELPVSALALGADLVNHSVHKTLAGLTQTALLHVRGSLVNREKLRHYLDVFQSSSPSYVLMTSIDEAVQDIRRYGPVRFADLLTYKKEILECAAQFTHLQVAGETVVPDPCKIVICLRGDAASRMDGEALAARLREQYGIEAERAEKGHVILILTPYDTKEGIFRLKQALTEIDRNP